MREIDFKNFRNKKDAKIDEKTWHRRIGRELSGKSYEKGKKKAKTECHCTADRVWIFIESIQAVYLAYVVWH